LVAEAPTCLDWLRASPLDLETGPTADCSI
jgi:hypothetical protein